MPQTLRRPLRLRRPSLALHAIGGRHHVWFGLRAASAVRPVAVVRTPLALLAVAVLAGTLVAPGPSDAATPSEPPGIEAFMQALGRVESAGRYDAVNPVSGAYGKYQIMPFNWPVWAKTFLGDTKALQTPENQETVARGQLKVLYRWLGSWPRVAYWWLTGSSNPAVDQWNPVARKYVDRVMALAGGMGWPPAGAAPGAAPNAPSRTTTAATRSTATPTPKAIPLRLTEADPAIAYTGTWGTASHAGYVGGNVRYATDAGASASVTFTGRTFRWNGPVGPTRGSAQVWIDGQLVTTISAYAGDYAPSRALYVRDFGVAGTHTVRIVVVGTAGHPMVAIDELLVGV